VAAAALKAKTKAEETFDELDSDKNGSLNQKELAVLAKKLGQRWAHKDLQRYFHHLIRLQAFHMVQHNDMGTAQRHGMDVASGNIACIHVDGLESALEDEAAVTKLFSKFGTVVRSPPATSAMAASSAHGCSTAERAGESRGGIHGGGGAISTHAVVYMIRPSCWPGGDYGPHPQREEQGVLQS
jgi:hypothetical protein